MSIQHSVEKRPIANNLEAFWMPFTPNRIFKDNPRLLVGAEGVYYTTQDGRKILDGSSGLWCVSAGHGRKKITEAIKKQAEILDYATNFQMAHPSAFELAAKLTAIMPGDLNHLFYVNSGSEAVDTALKIALNYQRLRGQGQKQKLIGREKAYHGVGFGGLSVGGLGKNRMSFGNLLGGTDHLRHTLDLEHNAFTKGLPTWGDHLADDLERLVALHDASTIAAVIVEPVAGSSGVIVPSQGYLKRLRDLCTKHDILLIFDEVITAFGRLGKASGAERFGVQPDMITVAKGMTNGAVPMGGVFVSDKIYQTFMDGPPEMIEFFHGYTYSGHPLACAAGLATLEVYQEEGLFERSRDLEPYFEEAVHSLKGPQHIVDIRNFGLMAALEFAPDPSSKTSRAMKVFLSAFEKGLTVRYTGDVIALSPPFIFEKTHIDQMVDILRRAVQELN